MPRRNAQDGGHTVFTDHRIQRRPEATQAGLPAEVGIAAWREPPRELQKRNLGIAYIDVGMQRHTSSFIIQGYCGLSNYRTRIGWVCSARKRRASGPSPPFTTISITIL
jgi:hypothetical protein